MMKNKTTLFGLTLALTLALALLGFAGTMPRDDSAVIDVRDFPSYVIQPIKVVGVTYRGVAVEPGQAFTIASADYLSDLTIRVRNTSGLPLKYAEVTLDFPRDAMDNPTLPSVPFYKGFDFAHSVDYEPAPGYDITIAPGDEVDLKTDATAVGVFLEQSKNHLAETARRATALPWCVAFSATRVWRGGSFLNRDSPTHWTVDRKDESRRQAAIKKSPAVLARKTSYAPHVQNGCFVWVDSELLDCKLGDGSACTSGPTCCQCTVAQDKRRVAAFSEAGFRLTCKTIICKAGTTVCPCTKTVVLIDNLKSCVGG